MITYNKIISINREFSENHFILKGFGNGHASDIVLHNQEPLFKYPLMFLEDLPHGVNQNEFTFKFRVYFLAQVATLKEQGDDLLLTNENEVKSDMVSCAQDILSFWAKQKAFPDVELVRSGTITTFTDSTADRLTGCHVDIQLKQGFRWNLCSVPMIGVTPPPPPPSGVSIDIDLNGVLMRQNQSVNVDIPVYLFGTTDMIGAGVLGAAWFISAQDSDNNEIGIVVGGVINISDSQIQFQGIDIFTLLAQALYNIVIVNSLLNPIGTYNAIDDRFEIGDSELSINGDVVVDIPSTISIDQQVINNDSDQVGTLSGSNWLVGDTQVEISNGVSLLANVFTVAEGYTPVAIGTSLITINTTFFANLRATDPLDIDVVDDADGVTPVGYFSAGKWRVVLGGGTSTIAYCYPRTRQTDVFEGELLGEGQLFLNGVYDYPLVAGGIAPVLDNDHPFYKLDIVTAGTLPNIWGSEFKWTGQFGGYIDEFDVFHLVNGDVTTRAGAFPDGIAFNNYNGLDYPIDTVSTTTRSQLDSESYVDTLVFGGFADWRVCHPGEADAMGQFNNSNAFSNGLFNYAVTNHWTNETTPNNVTHGRFYNISDGSTLRRQVKTNTARFYMCRTH